MNDWLTMDNTGFPGLIAPASLKPFEFPSVVFRQDSFSGVNCPGLIEARFTDQSLDRIIAFSGVNCPGLIEARAGDTSEGRSPGFPGLIAPASLKLVLHRPDLRRGDVFRG